MKAVGYIRLSQMDERTTSPARQRQEIERLCEARGWDLVKVYEDLNVSGYAKNGKRPDLDRMLARLDGVDAVVFWKLDRLARGVRRFYDILQHCEAADVALVSTAEPFDTSSPMGRAMVGITAVFAELESDMISERAKAMHAHRKDQGLWAGRIPYGWNVQDGRLSPVPAEQAVITDVARRYVAGESFRRISADVGIHHPNLARMLRSERVLEALPDALAGRLVSELAARGREGTKAKRSLLGGIARCGICGKGMTVVGRAHDGPTGAYTCRERGHVSISLGWLEDHVTASVLDAIDTGKLMERIAKRSKRRPTVPAAELEARLELLERDYYELGSMPRERYLRRREGLLKRLQEAKEAQADAEIDLPLDLARNLSERWKDLSLHGRRQIIAAVLERVEVSKATNHGKIDPARVALVWRGV